MRRVSEGRGGLRCKPGDLARITSAWNRLLVGELVIVNHALPDGRWMTHLVGDPAFTVRSTGPGYVVTRRLKAKDSSLEPLTDEQKQAAIAAMIARVRLPHREAETAEAPA